MDAYLSIVRQEMLLRHGTLPEVYQMHFKCISRAAARGRGPAKQAGSLPFERLPELSEDLSAFTPRGPCYPVRLLIVGIWWLLREIELANLTVSCVRLEGSVAHLRLPSSKTDAAGEGTTRSLACACASDSAQLCPFHVLARHSEWATTFAQQLGRPVDRFPLFPNTDGEAVAKVEVVAVWMAATSAPLPRGVFAASVERPLARVKEANLVRLHAVGPSDRLANCRV